MAYRYFIARTLTLVFFLSFSHVLIADEVIVRNETLGLLKEGVKHIRAVATPNEKRIIDKIKISVPISPAPVRVRAFNGAFGREIELSTGYSTISRMIVNGFLIEDLYSLDGFGEKYARYTASTYATGRFGGGKAPWVTANLTKKERDTLLASEDFFRRQQGGHLLVLWYVLAHEIAHHVFNHSYGVNQSLEISRKQEKEADDWASNIFISMGLPPASAFSAHMYWYFLDEFGVKSEFRRSHPPELKRIRSMLQLSISRFDEWNNNETLIPKIPKEDTLNSFRSLLIYVENLIAEQSNFNQDKLDSVEFKECVKAMYNRCITSCQVDYGNPLDLCESDLCISNRSNLNFQLRCDDIIQ